MAEINEFKNKQRTEWMEFLWDRLLEKVVSSKSKTKARQIFDELLSDYEKNLITKRLAAIALIREGVGSKEIGEILWLSYATISSLKKNLLAKSGVYRSQRSHKTTKQANTKSNLSKQSKKFWVEELFGDIDLLELIKNPPRPRGLGVTGRDTSGYSR